MVIGEAFESGLVRRSASDADSTLKKAVRAAEASPPGRWRQCGCTWPMSWPCTHRNWASCSQADDNHFLSLRYLDRCMLHWSPTCTLTHTLPRSTQTLKCDADQQGTVCSVSLDLAQKHRLTALRTVQLPRLWYPSQQQHWRTSWTCTCVFTTRKLSGSFQDFSGQTSDRACVFSVQSRTRYLHTTRADSVEPTQSTHLHPNLLIRCACSERTAGHGLRFVIDVQTRTQSVERIAKIAITAHRATVRWSVL